MNAATPRVDALVAKWDDDGATRGSAFCELRDLARELERTVAERDTEIKTLSEKAGYWWGTIYTCARLVGVPVEEGIPSGVVRRVKELIETQEDPQK